MDRRHPVLTRRMATATTMLCVVGFPSGYALGSANAPEVAYYLAGMPTVVAVILYVMAPRFRESGVRWRPTAPRWEKRG